MTREERIEKVASMLGRLARSRELVLTWETWAERIVDALDEPVQEGGRPDDPRVEVVANILKRIVKLGPFAGDPMRIHREQAVRLLAAVDALDGPDPRVERLRSAIQSHLDTFGYDGHEGLADALADVEPDGALGGGNPEPSPPEDETARLRARVERLEKVAEAAREVVSLYERGRLGEWDPPVGTGALRSLRAALRCYLR